MPAFGKASRRRLETLHPDLQRLLTSAIQNGPDFAILCGHRTEAEQNEAYRLKRSQLNWPNSKHNEIPSKAVDVAPYPIDWDDLNRFRFLAGYLQGQADARGLKIRWGGDWDGDYMEHDERFRDLPHFELVDR